jgi:hypothetical protein
MCYSFAPWAVSSTLSYGWAALGSDPSSVCGRCFQLDFTGANHDGLNEPGSATLKGKSMIVQAINVGGDVSSGQFDLLIPGGGVGAYDGCTTQWGTSAERYGGFRAECESSSLDEIKSCVMRKCESTFSDKPDLLAGCEWYVNWFGAANNPMLTYKEVACPSDLNSKSGMNRSPNGSSCM